jgi:MFS family permease
MENERKEPLNTWVVTLGWVSFLSDVASEMIYPLLPNFLTQTLGAGPATLGLIEGLAESTASWMKLASGWLSDRTRRRKPMVVLGYAIAAVARPMVGLASSWAQVLAIRFCDRVGKGIRTSPRDALLADLTPPESRGRAFGLQRAMDNAGALAGPLLAFLLLRFWIRDVRTVFLLALFPGLAAVILLLWRIPETTRRASPIRPAVSPTRDRFPRAFWLATGIFVLFTLANSTDAFLLLRARNTGVPLWELPLLWGFFNGVKAAFGVPGGTLADRFGRAKTISLGWLIYALSYFGFALASSPIEIWSLFALYGLFFGLTEGAERALIADLVPAELRGRAFGIYHASVGLAALPASVLFGLWWRLLGPRVAFSVGAGIALAATIAMVAARSKMVGPAAVLQTPS